MDESGHQMAGQGTRWLASMKVEVITEILIADRYVGHIVGRVGIAKRAPFEAYRLVAVASLGLYLAEGAERSTDFPDFTSVLKVLLAFKQEVKGLIDTAELDKRKVRIEPGTGDFNRRCGPGVQTVGAGRVHGERILPSLEQERGVSACVKQKLTYLPWL
jgi:hypothetical protein